MILLATSLHLWRHRLTRILCQCSRLARLSYRLILEEGREERTVVCTLRVTLRSRRLLNRGTPPVSREVWHHLVSCRTSGTDSSAGLRPVPSPLRAMLSTTRPCRMTLQQAIRLLAMLRVKPDTRITEQAESISLVVMAAHRIRGVWLATSVPSTSTLSDRRSTHHSRQTPISNVMSCTTRDIIALSGGWLDSVAIIRICQPVKRRDVDLHGLHRGSTSIAFRRNSLQLVWMLWDVHEHYDERPLPYDC